MRKALKQRSVAIQSTDSISAEVRAQPAKLIQKAGFRNLLQKSVTVSPKGHGERHEGLSLPGERNSKSIQASLDGELSFQRREPAARNFESSLKRIYSTGNSYPRANAPRPASQTESGTKPPHPGTSHAVSTTFSSTFVPAQMEDVHFNRHEGSLAVVYNVGEKSGGVNSVSSSLGFFYGSQASRRFSDETVILIEDYHSYDQANVARRQDVDPSRRRNTHPCCGRKSSRSREILTRPVPLKVDEDIWEVDEMVCRICHEGEDVEPLIQPCLCKGSVGCVHAKCLKSWLEQSSTSRCELCNYPYAVQQTKKYTKCVSIKVFYKTVIDRRAMAYDVISFITITPLTLVGVVLCIQASAFSTAASDTNYQMGYVTKAGMIMLSGTIAVAYGVWLFTLLSFHYRSWKKWYYNCFDVEVLPVRMNSEERAEAARILGEELNRRQLPREQNPPPVLSVLQTPPNYGFYQGRLSVLPVRASLQPATNR